MLVLALTRGAASADEAANAVAPAAASRSRLEIGGVKLTMAYYPNGWHNLVRK